MSRHDYTKHSKKNQNEVTEPNEVIEELESEVVEPVEDPVANIEIEEVAEPEAKKPIDLNKTYDKGVVTGCDKLRVRSEPRFGNNVICEIDRGTKVMIDRSKSTFEYYKIYTETGIEGYCQKPYIK